MKDVGVAPWLAGAPANWTQVRLRYTVTSVKNGIWGDEPNGSEDVICVRVADFDRIRRRVVLEPPTLRAVEVAKRTGRLLRKGNLLIEKSGGGELQPVGTVVLYDLNVDLPVVCSNFIGRMAAAQGIDSTFLCYLHQAIYEYGAAEYAINQTTGIQNLDISAYLDHRIAVPPVGVQWAVSEFVSRRVAIIDKIVEAKNRLGELLRERRARAIADAVLLGLNPDVRKRDSGYLWIGRIPEHWRMLRLKYISPRISGRLVYQPAQYFSADGVPFLMGNNITERGIDWADVKRIPTEINDRFSRHALRAGDVVTVRVGAPGVTCVVPREADGLNCGSLMIVRRSASYDSRWLAYVMNSPLVRSQVAMYQYGAAQEQINISDAVNFIVPVPPLAEQRRIADCLDRETRRIDELIELSVRQLALIAEYRQALITAAVTGQIDVTREPS